MPKFWYSSLQSLPKSAVFRIQELTTPDSFTSWNALTVAPSCRHCSGLSNLRFKAVYFENEFERVCIAKLYPAHRAPLDHQKKKECLKFTIDRYRDTSKFVDFCFRIHPACMYFLMICTYKCTLTSHPPIKLQIRLPLKWACKGIHLKILSCPLGTTWPSHEEWIFEIYYWPLQRHIKFCRFLFSNSPSMHISPHDLHL